MNKKITAIIAFCGLSLTALAQEAAPAFPGAEGHGRYVAGGRAADGQTKVYHVTNLNNSGTGSLRWALSQAGPRTIVFDVAGVIALESNLTIPSNTTIAGQTAPFPGITLRYYTISTEERNNIIIRFVRFRRGQEKNFSDGADAATGRHSTGIIFDHCSFSWSIDEVASFYDNNNFTMQWCTVGEALHNAGHNKGNHGYGGIWGGKLASFHHNMLFHVRNRSPRFNGARYNWNGYKQNKLYSQYQWSNTVQAEIVDFRNCVVYNCPNGCYGGPGGGYINMVNNYFKTGPAGSTNKVTTVSIANSTSSSDNQTYWRMTSRYFIQGNQVNDKANHDWTNVSYDSGVYTIDGEKYTFDNNHYYGEGVTYVKNSDGEDCVSIKVDQPAEAGFVTTHSAMQAFDNVLAYAGASLFRDREDARYAEEALTGTATCTGRVTKKKGQIDVVEDIPYYADGYVLPEGNGNTRPEGWDTDQDGMPDEWETANGLNPNDPADAMLYTLDQTKQWYNNLEVYLNSIVEHIMKAGNANADSNMEEYYPTCVVTAIKSPEMSSEVKSVEYFALNGSRLEQPTKGVCIRRFTFADGTVSTDKVIKK